MKYDDASWHYGGNFPHDLPPIAGATHTGMFFAWALLSGFGSSFHLEDFPEGLSQLEKREITPGAYFFKFLDGKFVDSDLNEEGNAFTASYFDFQTGKFLADYEALLGKGLPELYYVADTWENFDLLKPLLDSRLKEWRETRG
jgi:hypothetical protein